MSRVFRLAPTEAPESAILDAVLRYLAVDRRVAWAQRFNTGAHVIAGVDARGRKTRRFIRYAFPGCSDVLGQLVTGHLLAVETKARTGRPTEDQAAFLARVISARGCAILARSVDDVREGLDHFCAGLGGGHEHGRQQEREHASSPECCSARRQDRHELKRERRLERVTR